jgi:uncharacterized membrane protein
MKQPANRLWNALVTALFVALAAVLCLLVQWRYAIFRNGVDLGIFTQVVAGVGQGFSSTAEGGVNHLLVHWSPIIATAWPFVRAFGPAGLEYLQAILVAAAIFPVWGLARARFSRPAAFALVAVAAIYPILWANGVGDFHEMAFVPLFSATLVYALDRRRWALGIVAATLLALTKEDQAFILAANGLLFALTARGDAAAKRAGLVVSSVAIAMALLYFGVVRPALNPHLAYDSLKFFNWSGAPMTHAAVASLLGSRLDYLLIVLAPLAFLPLLSRYGLFLIPGFIELFASSRPITLISGAHYSALLTGYALAAFVDGAFRLRARGPKLAAGAVITAAAISMWVAVFASPMEYWYYLYRRPNAHDALLEATLKRLPPRADVGSQDEIFAHLGLDPHASIDFTGQQWFIYDRARYSQRWQSVDEPAVRAAIARGVYCVASERDGIVLLRHSQRGKACLSSRTAD